MIRAGDPERQGPGSGPEAPEIGERAPASDFLVFDRAAARAVDAEAVERYGIPSIVLMENAARGLADAAIELLRGGGAALVVCGSGNNGGDGYALARHLHNRGVDVTTVAADASSARPPDAALNAEICRRMGVPRAGPEALDAPRTGVLVVDALLGTGLSREVQSPARDVIQAINRWRDQGCEVLAADLPSGLDCDRGVPLGAAVRATRTVTFVGVKLGFLQDEAQPYLGVVSVADIGAPKELLEQLGRRVTDGGRGGAGPG